MEATTAAYRQIEKWLSMDKGGSDNILVLTTRSSSAQHLQGFFQQSSRRANAETAVKVAGATARHCVVLHGKSNFLSGNSRCTDFDHECYTRANVAYSRATDLTVSACPVNMNGLTGVSQLIAAPQATKSQSSWKVVSRIVGGRSPSPPLPSLLL